MNSSFPKKTVSQGRCNLYDYIIFKTTFKFIEDALSSNPEDGAVNALRDHSAEMNR